MEIVVLVDNNWGIGQAGDQLVRIREDFQNFKSITSDGILVYGRKTLATFPEGKVLKNRENWILSRKKKAIKGAKVFNDINKLLKSVRKSESEGKKVFCIGGSEIYEQLIFHVDICHVSKVHKKYEEVDRYFPNLDNSDEWSLVESSETMHSDSAGVDYSFHIYERIH